MSLRGVALVVATALAALAGAGGASAASTGQLAPTRRAQPNITATMLAVNKYFNAITPAPPQHVAIVYRMAPVPHS